MYCWYFLTVTDLLSLRVGVNSPPGALKSRGINLNFLTLWTLVSAFSFDLSTHSWICEITAALLHASLDDSKSRPSFYFMYVLDSKDKLSVGWPVIAFISHLKVSSAEM